jgi:hypothetical protein
MVQGEKKNIFPHDSFSRPVSDIGGALKFLEGLGCSVLWPGIYFACTGHTQKNGAVSRVNLYI